MTRPIVASARSARDVRTRNARGGRTLFGTLRALLVPALLALLFAFAGVVHVTSRVLVVRAGYRLSQLDATHRGLSLENDRLRLELATLKNPARLDRYARQKLGMGPPAPTAVLTPPPSPTSTPSPAVLTAAPRSSVPALHLARGEPLRAHAAERER